jgi:hypothetical protein
MVELDGQQYTVNTPQENASEVIRWVNQYCIDNQIHNSRGEIASLEVSPGSPLYLIFLGFAYLATLCQNLIFSIGRMLNIGACTDRQLVALGEILRMRRKPESFTSVKTLVYASLDGACTITPATVATVQVGNTLVTFAPLFDITIPSGAAMVVLMQATSLGSFFMEANSITAFDEPPANFGSMISQPSLPGRPIESFDSFRRRVQLRSTAFSGIEKCISALRDLPGIQAANIYFNMSNSQQQIQGYPVDSRKALVFIQGYNANIAKTIFGYLICDMMPLSVSQNVTLNNGQTLTAYWDTPVFTPLYIQVFLEGDISVALNAAVVTAVQSLAMNTDIASPVTTADILRVIQNQVPTAVVTGAHMRRGESGQWQQRLVSGNNELFEFNRSNIEVTNAV